MKITQERLKELFNYNPQTGLFTRKRNKKVAANLHNGYVRIFIDNREYYAHRLAWLFMTGRIPSGIIDHKNHNKTDNRWSNLREVSHQENCKNMPQYESNSSGTTGIYWHKRDKHWVACIHVNGKKKHLGCFKNKSDAIRERLHASEEYGFHTNHGKRIA